jgi:hypothetical protein
MTVFVPNWRNYNNISWLLADTDVCVSGFQLRVPCRVYWAPQHPVCGELPSGVSVALLAA